MFFVVVVFFFFFFFCAKRPFETVFQSISGRLPKRGRKKGETIDKRKKCPKKPPPAPTASAIGPRPTIIQISSTPWHWKFTQHHRTTRPYFCEIIFKSAYWLRRRCCLKGFSFLSLMAILFSRREGKRSEK